MDDNVKGGMRDAKGSRKARQAAGRLSAVQAIYQANLNNQDYRLVVLEYLDGRLGKTLDAAEEMVSPDKATFSSIVEGVSTHFSDIDNVLAQVVTGRNDASEVQRLSSEPLLKSILLCGAYELIMRQERDAPLVISDYLNITHAFFDQGEARLVNGVLDRLNKAVKGEKE